MYGKVKEIQSAEVFSKAVNQNISSMFTLILVVMNCEGEGIGKVKNNK